MAEFFAMGGYGFYVWWSYAVAALVVIAEIVGVRARRKSTLEEARLLQPETFAATATGGAR
jgi:heme exporter protein D